MPPHTHMDLVIASYTGPLLIGLCIIMRRYTRQQVMYAVWIAVLSPVILALGVALALMFWSYLGYSDELDTLMALEGR